MPNQDLMLKLAKVLIAVAWADGEVSHEEVNLLKDLLHRLPGAKGQRLALSAKDWQSLEMYMELPVGPDERARLVADLQNALWRADDKEHAIQALQEMVAADARQSGDELAVAQEVRAALEASETGLGGALQRVLGGAMERRARAVAGAPNRERYFEDFIRNKVYYTVSQRLRIDQKQLELSDAALRRLGLAGGLMAKVAHVDRDVSQTEFDQIVQSVRDHWALSLKEATLVAEIAVTAVDTTYDSFRMMRELATTTGEAERRQFLEILFEVANADGHISFEETEEIRLIAQGINLTHRDFIDAKLAVLGESRLGD